MQHHYSDADRGYGVTSVLWDIIFRSELKDKHLELIGGNKKLEKQ